MPPLALRYELDPATGRPRLSVPFGRLTAAEHAGLEAEMGRHYERLVRATPRRVRFQTPLASVPAPAWFRLRLASGSSPRCPTLLLRAEQAPRPAAPAWVEGFLAELEEALAGAYLREEDPAKCAALRRRIEHLSARLRAQPAALARTLVRGYLDLARRRPAKPVARP